MGIALGVAVMLISIAVVTGFQNEIRKKVIGFGSHIQITDFSEGPLSTPPLEVEQDFYPSLEELDGVKNIQQFALKQGILETPENVEGVIAKGVGEDYSWDFLREHLVEGGLLKTDIDSLRNEILISEYLQDRLELELGQKVAVYFTDDGGDMKQRNFRIAGIYNTGLQELDAKFVFINLSVLRDIEGWGIESYLVSKGCRKDSLFLQARAFGGRNVFRYAWSDSSLTGEGPHGFCIKSDTTIAVKVYDKWQTIPDTAYMNVSANSWDGTCKCGENLTMNASSTGGSAKYYTGGFEVTLDNYEDLKRMDALIFNQIGYDLKISTIHERNPEIFNWLGMLDMNVIVLLTLMVVVAVVNMTSALLVLILEKTNMIGMLKAMGASNWSIRKVFLYHAAYLIAVGVIAGNVIGFSVCLIQQQFGLLKLDQTQYYLSEVPVLLEGGPLILMNVGTLIICLLVLIIPTYIITRIQPVKAIRFD